MLNMQCTMQHRTRRKSEKAKNSIDHCPMAILEQDIEKQVSLKNVLPHSMK